MLEKNITKRDAITLMIMLDTGLINYKHYMCWIDEKILKDQEPALWALELATNKNTQSAMEHLKTYAFSKPFEDFKLRAFKDEYIACQWLRYKRKEISWSTFLLECGKYADAHFTRSESKYFFSLYNDIEDSAYSLEIEKKQRLDIFKMFSDVIREVEKKYREFLPYLKKYRETYGL
ncbi:MAG: hypothetical protein AAGB12_07670 [Pseudomonadota bacterium]